MKHLKPRKDGQYMIQSLLPPKRGSLFVSYVESELEKSPSLFIKELVFKFLEETFPEVYGELEEEDEQNWQRTVVRRAKGKKKAQEKREIKLFGSKENAQIANLLPDRLYRKLRSEELNQPSTHFENKDPKDFNEETF
tara:strand:- start:336 stop:749 length:414 start_codon:yes stop_codon:yes gene_type:complete